MGKSKLLRSMLFIPANSWKMIINGLSGEQDAVVFDLEDAVPLTEKETGRIFARDAIRMFKEKGIDVFVRINSISTGLAEEDLAYIVTPELDGVMLPKTETNSDVSKLDELLLKEEQEKRLEPSSVSIIPIAESPLGVKNIYEIALASPRIIGLGFGAGDF